MRLHLKCVTTAASMCRYLAPWTAAQPCVSTRAQMQNENCRLIQDRDDSQDNDSERVETRGGQSLATEANDENRRNAAQSKTWTCVPKSKHVARSTDLSLLKKSCHSPRHEGKIDEVGSVAFSAYVKACDEHIRALPLASPFDVLTALTTMSTKERFEVSWNPDSETTRHKTNSL